MTMKMALRYNIFSVKVHVHCILNYKSPGEGFSGGLI